MFEELLFMGGFLLFSILVSYLLFKYIPSPLNKVVRALAIVGIVIHELCHVLMCLITNTSIEHIKLLERTETKYGSNKYEYNGRVKVNSQKRLTFLQALLISLAPLIFSFWLFFSLWELLLTTSLNLFLFFLVIFVMVSIVLAASPSAADLFCIPAAFKEDPRYSMYQIFLLILSIITVWSIIVINQFSFIHEIISYILIMVFYYIYKYSFIGIDKIWYVIFLKKRDPNQQKLKYRRFMRRRFKPTKPHKLGIREAPW